MCLISVCVFVPLSGIYPLSASKESRKKLEMWCTLVCFYFWFGVLNCPLLLRWLVEISVLEVFLLSECWTQGKKAFPDILTHILRFLCYFRSLGMWDELYPINIYVCAGLVKKEHEKFPLSLQGWPPAVTIAYRAQLAQFLQCSEKVFVPYWFLCYLVCLFFAYLSQVLILDQSSPSKYTMQFLNYSFFERTKTVQLGPMWKSNYTLVKFRINCD